MVRPESQAIVAMIEEVVVRPEWETRNDPVRQT
jgi:hypothetical protein